MSDRRQPRPAKATRRRTAKQERQALQALIREHGGNLSAVAEALTAAKLPITRQALTRKLARMDLLVEAETLRHAGRLSGPRTHLPGGAPDPTAEAQQLVDALAKHSTAQAAADSIGISRRTLFRRVKHYRITDTKIARRQRELAAQGATSTAA